MNRTEVGIFEETYQICLYCLLKRNNDGALEPKISLEILSNLTNQELEWKFANQKLGSLWYFMISLRATVPGLNWYGSLRHL
uniref:Uncharacterized protein n=1 Tax=Nelumbo nucifera TaxID=4432 RepID=A0A822ZQV8_NELNU|nr:TPA_asm: hypothetical protein HUJ06_003959 [Nelumbo nucifera]